MEGQHSMEGRHVRTRKRSLVRKVLVVRYKGNDEPVYLSQKGSMVSVALDMDYDGQLKSLLLDSNRPPHRNLVVAVAAPVVDHTSFSTISGS